MQEVQPRQETASFIFGKGGEKNKEEGAESYLVVFLEGRPAGRVGGRCLWKVTASCCGPG